MAENKMTVRSNDPQSSFKWKEVAIGGISGIVLGTAGAYAAGKMTDDIELADDVDPDDLVDIIGEDNPTMASGVNDSMSFSQAFAAARSEVGAGGTFVWHGKVYGTYYANEWNAMSPAERHEFTSNAISGSHDNHDVHGSYAHTTTAGHNSHDDVTGGDTTHDNHTTTTGGGTTTQVSLGGDDDEVEFLGVTQVETSSGDVMNIGHASYGGGDYYLIDVDNTDDRFDYIAHDSNLNGKIDESEIEELDGVDISVSDFQHASTVQGYTDLNGNDDSDPADVYYTQADDMPDYVNDADTGELA